MVPFCIFYIGRGGETGFFTISSGKAWCLSPPPERCSELWIHLSVFHWAAVLIVSTPIQLGKLHRSTGAGMTLYNEQALFTSAYCHSESSSDWLLLWFRWMQSYVKLPPVVKNIMGMCRNAFFFFFGILQMSKLCVGKWVVVLGD